MSMKSVCCNDKNMVNKEHHQLKVKLYHKEADWYDSHIPVYVCECGKMWAVERVMN